MLETNDRRPDGAAGESTPGHHWPMFAEVRTSGGFVALVKCQGEGLALALHRAGPGETFAPMPLASVALTLGEVDLLTEALIGLAFIAEESAGIVAHLDAQGAQS